jgi:hypothetical protein
MEAFKERQSRLFATVLSFHANGTAWRKVDTCSASLFSIARPCVYDSESISRLPGLPRMDLKKNGRYLPPAVTSLSTDGMI